MSARSFNATSSRYGFNGKENDNETVGTGNGSQDYGARVYNPALGKFLSVDPLVKTYPSISPYPFAMNRPIDGIDIDGLEWSKSTDLRTMEATYTVKIKVVNSSKTMTTAQMETHMTNISKSLSDGVASANANAKINVVYEIVDKVNPSDFVLEFVDKPSEWGLGETKYNDNKVVNPTQVNHMQVNVGLDEYDGKKVDKSLVGKVGAHEIIHTTGIPDVQSFPSTTDKDGKHISHPLVKSMKENNGGKNLMWNIPDGSNLVKGQVELFDKYIPSDKNSVKFSPEPIKKDKTKVSTPNKASF